MIQPNISDQTTGQLIMLHPASCRASQRFCNLHSTRPLGCMGRFLDWAIAYWIITGSFARSLELSLTLSISLSLPPPFSLSLSLSLSLSRSLALSLSLSGMKAAHARDCSTLNEAPSLRTPPPSQRAVRSRGEHSALCAQELMGGHMASKCGEPPTGSCFHGGRYLETPMSFFGYDLFFLLEVTTYCPKKNYIGVSR